MTSVATPRGPVLVGVQVVDTKFVVPPHGPAYYEIYVAASGDEDPAILLTRDRALYQAAEDAYGTGERVDVEWVSRALDRKPVWAIVAIRRSV